MTRELFLRFVWKEYRQMRGFWLALLGIFALLQWTFLWLGEINSAVPLFAIGYVGMLAYATGCSATMFAVENEERTIDFLRSQPLEAQPVLWGKLGFCTASTVAIGIALCGTAGAMAYWFGHLMVERVRGTAIPAPDAVAWLCFLLGVALMVVLGSYFSLRTRRPMIAALLTATAGGLGSWLYWVLADHARDTAVRERTILPLVAAGLATIGLAALLSWRRLPFWFYGRKRDRTQVLDQEHAQGVRATLPERTRALASLLWQSWQRSRRLMAVLIGTGLLLTTANAASAPYNESVSGVIVTLAIWFSLFGSCVFLADQESHQYRFAAEQGVSARMLWLGRQIAWVAALAVFLLLVMVAHVFVIWWMGSDYGAVTPSNIVGELTESQYRERQLLASQLRGTLPAVPPAWLVAATLVATSYAAGQFASMVIRSGILAGFAGVILSSLSCLWVVVMVRLDVPWWWSALPMPLIFLGATWLYAPQWIRESRGWRGWPALVGSVAVPFLALFCAFCLYRVYEIPATDPGFSPAEFARKADPKDLATMKLYDEAMSSFAPMLDEMGRYVFQRESHRWQELSPDEIAWVEANSRTLELLSQAASAGPTSLWGTWRVGEPPGFQGLYQVPNGVTLVLAAARREEMNDDLDGAWKWYRRALSIVRELTEYRGESTMQYEQHTLERILLWGARPTQTPERVRSALKELQAWSHDMPWPDEPIKENHVFNIAFLEQDPAIWSTLDDRTSKDLRRLGSVMPWEVIRARRVLNQSTHSDLKLLGEATRQVAEGKPLRDWWIANLGPIYPPDWSTVRIEKWAALSPLMNLANFSSRFWRCLECVQGLTWRRAAETILALEVWRLEHGELPEKLDDLVGNGLDELPLDPWSGEPFVYAPEGVNVELGNEDAPIRRGSPFLVSGRSRTSAMELRAVVSRLQEQPANDGGRVDPESGGMGMGGGSNTSSDAEMLSNQQIFLIPERDVQED